MTAGRRLVMVAAAGILPVGTCGASPAHAQTEAPHSFTINFFFPLGHIGTAGTLPAPCPEEAPPVPLLESPQSPAADSVRSAVAAALTVRGTATEPEMVSAQEESIVKFQVALLYDGNSRYPGECLVSLVDQGKLPMGSLPGATWFMVGALQRFGDKRRITVRILRLETGEVIRAGKGDGEGPDALVDAVEAAFTQMGVHFGKPIEE